jgi:hypothetical protein
MTRYLGKKKLNYIHKSFKLGIIRISFFKLNKKWTIRMEMSYGWEK